MQLNFDASQVKPAEGFDTIPAGWYKAIIDQSEMRPTKSGTGLRLNLRFNVIEGQYAGRKIFVGLNLQNENEKAVEIALGQLSAIAHAVGVIQVADSQQLHNLPMFIKVKIVKDKDGQYEDKNDINTWKNVNDPMAIAAAMPAPAAGTGWAPPPGATPPGSPPAGWTAPAAPQPWAQPAAAAAPPTAAAPAVAAPAPWTPPGAPAGTQAWQHQPPAAGPAAAVPPQPPHPAQSAPPPWQQPAAAQAQPGGATPPWQQQQAK